ncbi:rRNA maturation RNase YbeY [Desnuesiella massiliensis]|uniref:rRNA maturation RNase YbeY n=1 Tax=Desnuesiella massiliensis TaxID=1650662 RepID=UPI0006E3B720|nr:rRNA maturation RNase YbeY [Desnuesiella massiliensis]
MIYIENMQSKVEAPEELKKQIEAVIDFALKEEEVNQSYEISVLLVDNEEIKRINKEHRNIDKETDVLSFPMLDYPKRNVFREVYKDFSFGKTFLDGENLVLGDIVLSMEKAREQSEEYGHSFFREVFYLIIHSVLHLLGYDHMTEEEKTLMRLREEQILEKLNIIR